MTRAAWDRRDDEGAKAYAAFELYRDLMGPRTIAAVAAKCQKSVSLLNRWSQRYEWPARAAAFDAQVSARVAAQSIEDHAAIRLRIAKDARDWQEFSIEARGATDPGRVDPRSAAAIWKAAVDAEFKAAGIADKSEVDTSVRIEFGYDDGPSVPDDEGE